MGRLPSLGPEVLKSKGSRYPRLEAASESENHKLNGFFGISNLKCWVLGPFGNATYFGLLG